MAVLWSADEKIAAYRNAIRILIKNRVVTSSEKTQSYALFCEAVGHNRRSIRSFTERIGLASRSSPTSNGRRAQTEEERLVTHEEALGRDCDSSYYLSDSAQNDDDAFEQFQDCINISSCPSASRPDRECSTDSDDSLGAFLRRISHHASSMPPRSISSRSSPSNTMGCKVPSAAGTESHDSFRGCIACEKTIAKMSPRKNLVITNIALPQNLKSLARTSETSEDSTQRGASSIIDLTGECESGNLFELRSGIPFEPEHATTSTDPQRTSKGKATHFRDEGGDDHETLSRLLRRHEKRQKRGKSRVTPPSDLWKAE